MQDEMQEYAEKAMNESVAQLHKTIAFNERGWWCALIGGSGALGSFASDALLVFNRLPRARPFMSVLSSVAMFGGIFGVLHYNTKETRSYGNAGFLAASSTHFINLRNDLRHGDDPSATAVRFEKIKASYNDGIIPT